MDIEIKLPRWGDDMEEGEIGEWLVGIGDQFTKGQIIATIEIDKTIAELEAPFGGKITSILCQIGEVVPVGHVIALAEGP